MTRFGWIWSFFRFIWAIKGLISIVLLAFSLFMLLVNETFEHRRTMLLEFSAAMQLVTESEADVRANGEIVFREPSRSGEYVTVVQAEQLEQSVLELRSNLVAIVAPTQAIDSARDQYANQLAELQGRLNLFSPDLEGTLALLEGLVLIQTSADLFHVAASRYKSSTWISFWAAI